MPETTPEKPDWRSLWGVLVVQTQNAFNDKFAQFVLLGLAVLFLPAAQSESYPHQLGYMLSAPFVVFAPLAGWLADRFSKRSVLLACLYAQVAVLVLVAVALSYRQFQMATWGFFLLAVQSAFFSPAKFGILKELVGGAKLAVASGWVQMLTIVGILAGTALGGIAFQVAYDRSGGDSWSAAATPVVTICFFSVAAILVGHRVRRTAPAGATRFHPSVLVAHFRHLGVVFGRRELRLTALGIAFFWFAGAFAQLLVIQVGVAIAPSPEAASAVSGKLQAATGLGIALGSFAVAFLSSQRIELGLVPVGGAGLALASAAAACSPPGGTAYLVALTAVGFSGALFLVPLNAFLQDRAEPSQRGRVLSASALMDALASLLGIATQQALVAAGASPETQFLLLAGLSAAAALYVTRLLPKNLVRFLALTAFRIVYRVAAVGADRIPRTGGALLLPNHLSYIDAFVLSAACPREVRFVIFDHYYKNPLLRPFLKLFGVVPISASRAKDAVRTIARALADGDLVCLFPEGQLSRTGCLNEIKKGFELMVRKPGTPVVPATMDGLWGSVFSCERGRFFRKLPHRLPFHIRVVFGEPVPAPDATAARVRHELNSLAADALDTRPELDTPLATAFARALHRRPWKTSVVEYAGRRPTTLNRAAVYATAVALGERWKDTLEGERVAVVLPESSTALLVHLGLVFAGKTPVTVPLTNPAGPEAMADALAAAGVNTAVTLAKLPELLTTHRFPQHVVDVTAELDAIPSGSAFLTAAATYFRPPSLAPAPPASAPAMAYLHPDDGGLALVEVPARRLLATFAQLEMTNLYRTGDTLLARAPYASPLGLHFGLLYPLLKPVPVVHLPANADAAKTAAALDDHRPTLVTGALDAPSSFTPRVHIGVADAPALTAPAAGALLTLPQADPDVTSATAKFQPGTKPDTLGRLLPATIARPEETTLNLGSPALPPGGVTLDNTTADGDGFLVHTAPAP